MAWATRWLSRWLPAGCALGFALHFTLPAFESVQDSCGVASNAAEDHIVQAEAWDADIGSQLALLDTYRKAPGDTVAWWVEVFGPHRVYVIVRDERDNPSCPSDTVTVDGGPQPVTGIPPMVSARVRELFDLSGRRVAQPARSGIYFERVTTADGRRTRRVVRVK
jgi:plastocyanin